MGEVYQFKCLECELEIKLGREKGGGFDLNALKFYKYNPKNKSSLNKSNLFNNYPIGITSNSPELREVTVRNQNGEIIANCPCCNSNHTILFKLDDWIVDYQVW